jgi:hypothetical protein
MFKDPTTGNFYTQALFLELCYSSPANAIYTLKDEDYEHNGKTYKSIKRLYLEIADPTEYAFATQCFAGWSHWKRLCEKTTNLHSHIAEWRDELEVKMRSEGVRGVVEEAVTGGKGALQASKWLADKGWTDKRSAGRPSKKEVEGELKQQAGIKSALDKDLERVLNVH